MDWLHDELIEKAGIDQPVVAWGDEEGVDDEAVRERLYDASDALMAQKAAQFGPDQMRQIEKQLLLQIIDTKWREHLLALEHATDRRPRGRRVVADLWIRLTTHGLLELRRRHRDGTAPRRRRVDADLPVTGRQGALAAALY